MCDEVYICAKVSCFVLLLNLILIATTAGLICKAHKSELAYERENPDIQRYADSHYWHDWLLKSRLSRMHRNTLPQKVSSTPIRGEDFKGILRLIHSAKRDQDSTYVDPHGTTSS